MKLSGAGHTGRAGFHQGVDTVFIGPGGVEVLQDL